MQICLEPAAADWTRAAKLLKDFNGACGEWMFSSVRRGSRNLGQRTASLEIRQSARPTANLSPWQLFFEVTDLR